MIGNKRIIGVCITKLQDTAKSRKIQYLHEEATKNGYKLIIFNSSFDITADINNQIGATGIYDYINYGIMDAIIIFTGGFIDASAYKSIVDKAKEANIPVILENNLDDNCFTVRNNIDIAFEALINHVIKDHGITDTFFIAGIKNNLFSNERIEIYKKVLKDNGLEFSEDLVDYGGFWEGPTREVMSRLLSREKLPKAIICANDAMAIAVCEILAKNGINVPEDIIVTGFDGSPGALFSKPEITTCIIDAEGFAKKCIGILDAYFDGVNPERYVENPYIFKCSESCGCKESSNTDFRAMAKNYHKLFTGMNGHEYVIYNQIIYQLNSEGMNSGAFFGSIARILDKDAYLSFHSFFLPYAIGSANVLEFNDDKMFIVSAGYGKSNEGITEFNSADMVPNLTDWIRDDSMYVLNAVNIGKNVVGLYQVQTNDIIADSQKMNRVLNIVNMMVHMAVSDVRQRFIRTNESKDITTDNVTELANREGMTRWYEEYINKPENYKKFIILSLYQIPKYNFICENYGVSETRDMICYIAEILRLANPKDSYIARIADDEFALINFYDDWEVGGQDIRRSTQIIFGMIESFNQNSNKDYNIEVNAGCIVAQASDKEKFESLVRKATDELYKNREIYGAKSALKEKVTSTRQQYDLFNALISNNMFKYFFQPIVRADNGEIHAYEALMRTDASIGFNPLEVLSIAREYQRLYDIEKATMFNVMERYSKSKEVFKDRKVFINSIPGYFLNENDNEKLSKKYSNIIDNFVFEITEQDTITAEELEQIKHIGNEYGTNIIAVDDYGTGHSNLVNLINYAPHIVKIDRFLMTDINSDDNKQMLVKGVIDFAKRNDIRVLAEGVETREELKKVIELGVDYIQGYYTGRPVLDPIDEIDSEIKSEIISFYKMSKRAEE